MDRKVLMKRQISIVHGYILYCLSWRMVNLMNEQRPYQWLIKELQDLIDCHNTHGIDSSNLSALLERAKEKQRMIEKDGSSSE